MKRVTHIAGIALDNPLNISTEFDIDDYLASKAVAIDGSTVMFVQPKGAMTREVTVYSKSNTGWIEEATKDLLIAAVGTGVVELTFDDLSVANYYFDHTKVPMTFEPLYTGCTWYNVTINLLKG